MSQEEKENSFVAPSVAPVKDVVVEVKLENTLADARQEIVLDNDVSKSDMTPDKQDIDSEQETAGATQDKVATPEVPLWAIFNVPAKSLPVFDIANQSESMDSLEIIFQRSILGILESLDISSKSLAVEKLADLALAYLHGLVYNLRKLIEIQRRRKPALKDLKLLMQQNNIKLIDLFDEYKRSNLRNSKDAKLKLLITKLNESTDHIIELKSNPDFEIDETDPSAPLFYNQTFEILDLIPSTTKLKFPKMFPQLPPDYTYKKTGSYNKLVTDPHIVRERLVEESRYGEKALNHLLHGSPDYELNAASEDDNDDDDDRTLVGDDGELKERESLKDGDSESLLMNGSQLLAQLPTSRAAAESVSLSNPRAFDIEAFAKKRLEILRKRQEKLEMEIKLKRELPINQISYDLGSYTQIPPLKMKDDSVANLISKCLLDEFENTQNAVKISTKKRRLKLKLERQKRQRLLLQQELERQRNGIEQTFEFGDGGEEEEIDDFEFVDDVPEERNDSDQNERHVNSSFEQGSVPLSSKEELVQAELSGGVDGLVVLVKAEEETNIPINDTSDREVLTVANGGTQVEGIPEKLETLSLVDANPAPVSPVVSSSEDDDDDNIFDDV